MPRRHCFSAHVYTAGEVINVMYTVLCIIMWPGQRGSCQRATSRLVLLLQCILTVHPPSFPRLDTSSLLQQTDAEQTDPPEC